MKNSILIIVPLILLSFFSFAQEMQESHSEVPVLLEPILGTERYFFQVTNLNTIHTDSIRNAYKQAAIVYNLGVETIISKFFSSRLTFGYSFWDVNLSRAKNFIGNGAVLDPSVEVTRSKRMEVFCINPDVKIFYPGTTKKISAYFTLGLTAYFTVQKAMLKVKNTPQPDVALAPVSSLNGNIGIGGEWRLNNSLLLFAECKYGQEILNLTLANNSKWRNIAPSVGVSLTLK